MATERGGVATERGGAAAERGGAARGATAPRFPYIGPSGAIQRRGFPDGPGWPGPRTATHDQGRRLPETGRQPRLPRSWLMYGETGGAPDAARLRHAESASIHIHRPQWCCPTSGLPGGPERPGSCTATHAPDREAPESGRRRRRPRSWLRDGKETWAASEARPTGTRRYPWAATHSATISERVARPTAPSPRTASWNPRMSNRGPSAACASVRSRRISRWPIL